MKKGIVVLLLVSSFFANAQTLKEALYGGKLKNQPGTVIRKGDDLSTKIDTVRTTPPTDTASSTTPQTGADSARQSTPVTSDTSLVATTDTAGIANDAINPAPTSAAAPANNNSLWKTYMDSVASSVKSEVLSSKKIKRGTYAVLVTYAIGLDGQTTVTDVFVSPENAYLQQQVKSRLDVDTPRLNPVLNSAGAPRKVVRKHNFTVSKD